MARQPPSSTVHVTLQLRTNQMQYCGVEQSVNLQERHISEDVGSHCNPPLSYFFYDRSHVEYHIQFKFSLCINQKVVFTYLRLCFDVSHCEQLYSLKFYFSTNHTRK